jgi:hypothetical protein
MIKIDYKYIKILLLYIPHLSSNGTKCRPVFDYNIVTVTGSHFQSSLSVRFVYSKSRD